MQGGAQVTNRIVSFWNVHPRSSEVAEGTAAAPASSVQSASSRTAADMAPSHASARLPPPTHAEAVGKLREIVQDEFPSIASVFAQAPSEDYTGSGIYVMFAGLKVRSVTCTRPATCSALRKK